MSERPPRRQRFAWLEVIARETRRAIHLERASLEGRINWGLLVLATFLLGVYLLGARHFDVKYVPATHAFSANVGADPVDIAQLVILFVLGGFACIAMIYVVDRFRRKAKDEDDEDA